MNNINEEKRIEVYRNSPEEIRELYVSDELTELINTLETKYELADKIRDFVTIVGDTILGFHQTTDLPRLFQKELGMGADDSQHLLGELTDFLAPVIKKEGEAVRAKKEDIDRLAKSFSETKGGPREIQPDGKPEDVKPLRTMEGDMNRVHGYGAYRAQETQSQQPPAPTPARPAATTPTPPTSVATNPTPQPAASGFTPASVANKYASKPLTTPSPISPAAKMEDEPVYRAEDQAEMLKRNAAPRPMTPVTPPAAPAESRSAANYMNQTTPTPAAAAPRPITTSDSAPNNIPLQKPATLTPNNPEPNDISQVPLRKVK